MTQQSHSRLVRALIWSVVAAAALYVVIVVAADLEQVGAAVGRLGWDGGAIVLGLSLFNYLLRFVRWEYNLALFGHHVAHRRSLLYYFAGFAFSTTPGKAGEGMRSLYYKRHDVPYVHSLANFFAERFLDVTAVVILSSAVAYAFPITRWPIGLLTVALIAMLPVIHHARVQGWFVKLIQRIKHDKVRKVSHHLVDLLRSASTLMRSGPLYIGLSVGIVAWAAEGVGLWVILDRMGVEMTVMLAIGIYSAAILTGAATFLPGGLGTAEAVMTLLLVLSGVDTSTAVAATVICRLATLWFVVSLGVVTLGVLQMREGKAVAPAS